MGTGHCRRGLLLAAAFAAAVLPGCGSGGGGGGSRKKKDLGFRVSSIDPVDGAVSVPRDTTITVTFSDPIRKPTLSTDNFLLSERISGVRVAGTLTFLKANQVVVFTPNSSLERLMRYRVRILPDVTSIADETLPQEFESFFTTALSDEPPPPPPPPPAPGSIRRVSDMKVGRSSHRATLLADGKVLVTGGFHTSAAVTNTAELFDPDTEKFAFTSAPMAIGRGFHTATRLRDGRVLVLGGVTGTALAETSSAEIYDPVTDSFSTLSVTMTRARAFHTATLLGDGRVLVAGGTVPGSGGAFSSRTAEIYDPAAGTFTALPDMAAYRAGHTATLLGDGCVLLAGGHGTDRTLEIFDPRTDTFRTLDARLKVARRGHTATLLQDGNVLLVGGGDRSGELYVTDRDYTRWTNGFPLWDRKDHTADLLADGAVLLTGGSRYVGSQLFFNRTTELYDARSGSFLGSGPNLSYPTTRHRTVALENGDILITGGSNLDPTLPEMKTAEIYERTD